MSVPLNSGQMHIFFDIPNYRRIGSWFLSDIYRGSGYDGALICFCRKG